MLCLSGFELYSLWVPLKHFADRLITGMTYQSCIVVTENASN